MSHPGFTQPVELRCVLDAGKAMRRMIPVLLIMGFAVWMLAALPLGLMFPKSGVPAYAGGITIALLVVGMVYLRKRRELDHRGHRRLAAALPARPGAAAGVGATAKVHRCPP
ncbi:hypothetical protein [Mycolicibacterium brumae]|uniref:Uncharacterized protein n=1 Tax=Mycolicibacterium brumae TaxID=85968 RepID=A0A2G5PA07_9MYCO|nr:hypothetical protein [Mycolicibacterium brumae]MCV7192987.1 hypothetical protein [Mycolicibacterium brumae]PIB75182.1 hypothetical protein CQY22_009935 [Mycolicibacterium brumae]UWW08494.1 hypothetical protein L2Z93_001555 [Mycolicibacterium brumae]